MVVGRDLRPGRADGLQDHECDGGLKQMRSQLDNGAATTGPALPGDRAGSTSCAPRARGRCSTRPKFSSMTRYDESVKPDLERIAHPNTAISGAGLYAFGSFSSPPWMTESRDRPDAHPHRHPAVRDQRRSASR